MKIAIITSGILPVPALLGGAVENLIDYYLTHNEEMGQHEITVYSVCSKKINSSGLLKHTHYKYVVDSGFLYKLKRKLFGVTHQHGLYYHYHIEYFLQQTIKDLRTQAFDLIILENRPGYTLTVARACPATPIALHLHNDLLNANTPHAADIKNHCALILPVSNYIRRRVDSIGPPYKCRVCHNGIDLKRFQHIGSRAETRAALGFTDSDFIIAYSGRINPEKGVKELIEAICLLSDYPDIKLLIIGGSFFGNDTSESPYMKELHQLATSCKERIVFTGFKPYEQMPSLLGCADVGTVPSVWEEPFALTCAEGMAAGLPLVVTRSGGIPEVADEACAIFVPIEENLPRLLANAFISLYGNQDKRHAMSRHAKQRVTRFRKEIYARKFFELLAESSRMD